MAITSASSPSSRFDARHQAFDQSDVAVDPARAQRGHGVAADDFARRFELDARQPRRALEQAVHGGAQARRQRGAEQAAVAVDGVEGRRGAEVDDDRGHAVQLGGGQGVDDAVGAHLARVVDGDR